jgi:hypothetical protein
MPRDGNSGSQGKAGKKVRRYAKREAEKRVREEARPKSRKGKAKGKREGASAPGLTSTHARKGARVLSQVKQAVEQGAERQAAEPGLELTLTETDLARREKDSRVEEVAILMAQGKWCTGPSHAELAQRWAVSLITVRAVASEASRIIRMLARYDRDDDAIRASLIARAAMIGQSALDKRRTLLRQVRQPDGSYQLVATEVPDPDHPSAIRAVELEGKLLGLLRQTVEVGGPDGGPIPVTAAAVVVLPAQLTDGDPQKAAQGAVETTGEALPQRKGNGQGRGPRGGNGKGGNGRG